MTTPAIIQNTEKAPTAQEIDTLAASYMEALAACKDADDILSGIEACAIDLVAKFGVVPPNAENSRRLSGNLNIFTVTTGSTTSIDEARVQDLAEAMYANHVENVFQNIFKPRIRHELVKGGELAILAAGFSTRLTEKLQKMFKQCFSSEKKKPSLKVKRLAEAKPRKSRAKKTQEATA